MAEKKEERNDVVVATRTREARQRAAKKQKGKTAAIIALSILLGLSLIFGVTAAFFSANATAGGNVTLGDPVNINITQGGASVTALTFDGLAMPGTTYNQVIGVSMPENTSQSVIRGKLTITNAEGASENLVATVNTTDWALNDADGYYYYNGVLSATESKDFVTQITVPKTLTNVDANKTFTINVQIEAIQFANGAASEVWTTATTDWITSYGSGTLPTA